MKVKLIFEKEAGIFSPPTLTVVADGPPLLVNDVVETLRKRIAEESKEKKEHTWEYVWKDWREK